MQDVKRTSLAEGVSSLHGEGGDGQGVWDPSPNTVRTCNISLSPSPPQNFPPADPPNPAVWDRTRPPKGQLGPTVCPAEPCRASPAYSAAFIPALR